ncbi:MAG TPA: cell wall hydrolase [Bacillota bacterium]|nr:cell wall hydrolase [Bacillota bacterium]
MKRTLIVVTLLILGTLGLWVGKRSQPLGRLFAIRSLDLSDLAFPAQVRGGWIYTVRRGDTLFTLARRFGLSTNTLRRANGLNSNALRLGQRLFIPTAGGGGAAATQPISRGRIDLEMMARLIRAEAEAEPYVGQVAVGAVLMNRIESPKFPKTLAGVIYQPHAFESVSNGSFYSPSTASTRKAAQAAVQGWDPSGGALFFFNPAKTSNRYIWSRRIIQRIGKHVFSL